MCWLSIFCTGTYNRGVKKMHNMYRTNYAALSIVDREDLASRTSTPMREERSSAREAGRLPGNFAKRTCFGNITKSFELSLLSELVPM